MRADIRRLAPQMGLEPEELMTKIADGEGGALVPLTTADSEGSGRMRTPRHVTDDAISRLEGEAARMEAEVSSRMIKREEILAELTMAWEELGVAEKQRKNFLGQNEGIKEE